MNDLDVNDIVCLFCCPPWPPRIVSKLAFLPPQPSYKFIHGDQSSNDDSLSSSNKYEIELFENAEWQFTNNEKSRIEGFYTRTSKGNRIACIFVKCAVGSLNARFTVLFSHGNAIDLGQMSSFYVRFANKLNCNIFSYDYSGYGVSGGQPSEKNVYADINAAWHCLRCYYAIDPNKIILYGQSIGTVPTIDLASKFHVAAVVLHSPLTSGLRVAFPLIKRTWFFDSFPSINKVPKIKSTILIIHGKDDQVIDVSHGLAIFEKCKQPVDPLFIDRAGHNDVELYTQYWDRLQKFLYLELTD